MRAARVNPSLHHIVLAMTLLFGVTGYAQELCDGKPIIGTHASIAFPKLGINALRAKVDTGAYNSSLHCSQMVIDPDAHTVSCHLAELPDAVILPLTRLKNVKSSNGKVERRPFVKLEVLLMGKRFVAEFSLTDRSQMRSPVLLGRTLLKHRFVVDVSR